MNKIPLLRKLTLWLAAYLGSAVMLFFYFHTPILPILFAGIGTFLLTLGLHFFSKR